MASCKTASFNVALNGLTSGTDAGLFGINFLGKESFHPNSFGHLLIANAILVATHNFAHAPALTATNQPPNSLTGNDLKVAPKTGCQINKLVQVPSLTASHAKKGQSTAISVPSGVGLAPNSHYKVTLDRGTADLGNLTTDNNGSLSGNVTIPTDTDPGDHTIDVVGTSAAGDPVDVTNPIYITHIDNDYDGVPNNQDSCPGVVNSSVDAHQDGVDDACDTLIGLTPTTQTNSGNSDPTPPTILLANSELGVPNNDPDQAHSKDASPQPATTSSLQTATIVEQLTTSSKAPVAPLSVSTVATIKKSDVALSKSQSSIMSPTSTAKLPGQGYAKLPILLPQQFNKSIVSLGLWLLLIAPTGYAVVKRR
jgi:hypothetical protein